MSIRHPFILSIPPAALFFFFAMAAVRDSRRFVVAKYRITSPKLRKKCRIVMLSDLQEPDLVLVAGDMVTANGEKTRIQEPLAFLRRLAAEYPVYYGNGNHEYRIKVYREDYGDIYDTYARELRKSGVRLLENGRVYLPEYHMEICGLEIGRRYYKRLRRTSMDRQYMEKLLGKADKVVGTCTRRRHAASVAWRRYFPVRPYFPEI